MAAVIMVLVSIAHKHARYKEDLRYENIAGLMSFFVIFFGTLYFVIAYRREKQRQALLSIPKSPYTKLIKTFGGILLLTAFCMIFIFYKQVKRYQEMAEIDDRNRELEQEQTQTS